MNTRSTIAWVLLSIALVAGYWLTGRLEEEKQRVAYEAKRIFDFDGKDVHRLAITLRGDDMVEATRLNESEWALSEPLAHVVPNHIVWSHLAEKVVPFLINERDIEATPEDLSLYELGDPLLSIVIETSAKELIQLDIGTNDPTRNNHYARLASGEVFLLPTEMAKALYQSLNELRDKRVFPGVDYTIDRIEYTRFEVDDPEDGIEPEPGIDEVYTLGEDDKWRITEPIDALAFQGEVYNLLNKALYLAGENFIDSPGALSDYGLDPPWATLSVMNTKDHVEQRLMFGWMDDMADDGRRFVAIEGNPTVFTIDAAFLSHLPEKPLDYRENHIFTGKASNLSSIEYADAYREFTLTNDETVGWVLTDPAYSDTDNIIVSQFINLMMQIAGDRFPDEDEIAQYFGEERIRYTFHYNDGSPSTSISIGGSVPETLDPVMFYARQDFGSVITIPYPFRQFFAVKPFRFRNRALMGFDPVSATALSIRLDGAAYSLVQAGGIWSVLVPENHEVESIADVTTLLTGLRGVFAMDIADPVPETDISGLDTPFMEASIRYSTPKGDRSKVLILGNLTAKEGRYRYAQVEGRDEVFYVDHGLIEDLRAGLQGIVAKE